MISHIQKHRRLRIQGSYQQRSEDTNNILCTEDLLFNRANNADVVERTPIISMRYQQQDEIQNSSNTRRRRARSSSSGSREETTSSTVVTPRSSCRDESEKDLLEMIDEILHAGHTSK